METFQCKMKKYLNARSHSFQNFQFSLDLKTIQCKVGKLVSSWHSPPPRLASTKSKRNPELYPLNFSVFLQKLILSENTRFSSHGYEGRQALHYKKENYNAEPSTISLFATSC